MQGYNKGTRKKMKINTGEYREDPYKAIQVDLNDSILFFIHKKVSEDEWAVRLSSIGPQVLDSAYIFISF